MSLETLKQQIEALAKAEKKPRAKSKETVPAVQIPDKWRKPTPRTSEDRYMGGMTLTTEEKRAARSLLASKKNKLDPKQITEVINTGKGDLLRYLAERTDLAPEHWDLMARISPNVVFGGTYSSRSKSENELKDKIFANLNQKQLFRIVTDKPKNEDRSGRYGLEKYRAVEKLDSQHLLNAFDPQLNVDPEVLNRGIRDNENFGREHLELALQYPNPKVGHVAVHSHLFQPADFERYKNVLRGSAKGALYKRAFMEWGKATPENINAVLSDPNKEARDEPLKVIPLGNEGIRDGIIQHHLDKPDVARAILAEDDKWDRRNQPSLLSEDQIMHILQLHHGNENVMGSFNKKHYEASPEIADFALKNASFRYGIPDDLLKSNTLSPQTISDYINGIDVKNISSREMESVSKLLDNPNIGPEHLNAMAAKMNEYVPRNQNQGRGGYSYDNIISDNNAANIKAKIATHPASAGTHVQNLDLSDEKILEKLATNRNAKLTPEMHQAISNAKNDETRRWYVMNNFKTMPEDARLKMLSDKNPKIRFEMATRTLKLPANEVSDDVLKTLLEDSSSKIRQKTFRFNLSPEMVAWASKSKKSGTRALAVAHPNATPEIINAAAKDKSEDVRMHAALTGKLGDAESEHVFNKAKHDNQLNLLTNKAFKVPNSAINKAIDDGNQQVLAVLSRKNSLDPEQMEKIYHAGDKSVKQEVAENTNTPSHVLEQAAFHNDKSIQYSAIRNPKLPIDTAKRFINTSDEDLMTALVSRPDADEDIFNKGLGLENHYVDSGMLENSNLPSRHVTELFNRHGENPRIAMNALKHPSASDELLMTASNHTDERIRRVAKDKIKLHNPDLYNQTLENGHDVNISPATERLKHLKGIIEQMPNQTVHKKEMEKLGHQNLPNQILDPKGNITPASIDAYENSLPKERYNVSYSKWEGMQRHDSSTPQKVVQLNLTNDHVKKLRDAGLWDTFKKVHDMSFRSGHPVDQHTLGWARIDESHPDHWHIDEIQSDLGRGTIQAIEKARTSGEMSDSEADKYSSHLKQMIKMLSGGHKTINHAIFSAVHAIGRKNGITSTSMDTLPDQMKQSGQSMDKSPPVHMKETYEELPKQTGFKNAPKKETMPNTKAPEAELQVRKLVKSLKILYKSMAALHEVTNSRHKKSGSAKQEATPATGKKKVPEREHVRSDTQSHLDYKDEHGKSLAFKDLHKADKNLFYTKDIARHWYETAYPGIKPNKEDLDEYKDMVLSHHKGNWILKDIPVSNILGHHSGHKDSAEFIKEYAHDRQMGSEYPPVILKEHPEKIGFFQTIDGQHRVAAANITNDKTIKAYVPAKETLHKTIISSNDEENFREDLEKSIPNNKVRSIADSYAKQNKINLVHLPTDIKVNPNFASKVASAYQNMQHAPNDPVTKSAYNTLINETMNQFRHLKNNGLKISTIHHGMERPYKNSNDLFEDIKNNNHLWYYPTELGFGQENSRADHPLLVPTNEMHNGKPLLANDVFRIVHDYFGHAKEGYSFGPHGEERAYREHKKFYSPLAQKALTSETRGQNSWVNFGPHGTSNKKNPENTVFAEQKAGLLPDWASEDYK